MEKYNAQQYGQITFYHSEDDHPRSSHFARHCHAHYEIIYVVQGTGKYVVEGERYELRPGTLMVFRPGEFHYVDVSEQERYERFVFHFRAEELPQAEGALSRLAARPLGVGNIYETSDFPIPVTGIFENFDRLESLPEQERAVLSRLYLTELVLLLSVAEPQSRGERRGEPIGAQIIRYLNENLAAPLSLEELAKHFYVSKYYLCRAFKEHNGISILGYLNGKRVMLARQMIEGGESAATAAERVGFCDYSTFYRAYRKTYGRSPTQQRKTGRSLHHE